jgi:hypothetical protein
MIEKLSIFYMQNTLGTINGDGRTSCFVFPMSAFDVEQNFEKLTIQDRKFVLQFVSSILGFNDIDKSVLKYHSSGYISEGKMMWKIPDLSGGTIQAIGVATSLMKSRKSIILKYPECGIHFLSVQALGKMILGIAGRKLGPRKNRGDIKNVIIETRSDAIIEGFRRSPYLDDVKEKELHYIYGRYCKKMTIYEFEKEFKHVERVTKDRWEKEKR